MPVLLKKGNRLSGETRYKALQNTSFIYTDTQEIAQYKTKKTHYIYNAADQLISSTEKMIDEQGIEILRKATTYTYDKNGNQTSQYSDYTHPYRLMMRQKVEGETLTDQTEEALSDLIDRTRYTYNGFNQVTSVEKIAEGTRNITHYTYNGEGLRTSKTEITREGNNTTTFLYDRQYVILETTENGQETFYLRGINYIGMEREALTYYLYNGHGDVIHTVDEAGTIKNQYAYDAFGNATFTLEVEANAIRYSGEYYDANTGLYYLRARYYNPYIGRFISEDSYWGEDDNPLSLNLYTYCHNDPVNYVDPSGHFAVNLGLALRLGNTFKNAGKIAKNVLNDSNEKKSSRDGSSGSKNKSNNSAPSYEEMESNTSNAATTKVGLLDHIVASANSVMNYIERPQIKSTIGSFPVNVQIGDVHLENATVVNGRTMGDIEQIANALGGSYIENSYLGYGVLKIRNQETGRMEEVLYDLETMKDDKGNLIKTNKDGKIQVSVREITQLAGVEDTLSYWSDSKGFNVLVRPEMKFSSVNVTRIESTIYVKAYVKFTGDVNDLFPSGVTCQEAAAAGILSNWNKNFRNNGWYDFEGEDIDIITELYGDKSQNALLKDGSDVNPRQEYLEIKIDNRDVEEGEVHRSHMKGGGSNWSISRPGSIVMYKNYDGGTDYPQQWYAKVSAHEFGHVLGINDAYPDLERNRKKAMETIENPLNMMMRNNQSLKQMKLKWYGKLGKQINGSIFKTTKEILVLR
jgi:RHS repeat-associated protein